MTSARAHVGNILNAAARGQGPDDEDLAPLPADIAGEVRGASNRLVALIAAGDQYGARNERLRSLDEIVDTMFAANFDPGSRIARNAADRQAVVDALDGNTDSDFRRQIADIPR